MTKHYKTSTMKDGIIKLELPFSFLFKKTEEYILYLEVLYKHTRNEHKKTRRLRLSHMGFEPTH